MIERMTHWLGMPPDWSESGHHIDFLIGLVHWAMVLIALGFVVYFVWVLVKFRAGSGREVSYEGARGRLGLSVAFAIFLAEIAILAFVEIPLMSERAKMPDPTASTMVRVTGEQFAWNFHYPGEDGLYGATSSDLIDSFNPVGLDFDDPAAADDLVTINVMHVPLGRPVLVDLRSKDVIHSFSIPLLRVKQDAIPGQSIAVSFEPTVAGETSIGCAQLCGLGHYRMKAVLTVESQEDFAAWYEEEMAYM